MKERGELRECPFCGGEAHRSTIPEMYFVRCQDCQGGTGIYETQEEADKLWNYTRTPPSEAGRGEWEKEFDKRFPTLVRIIDWHNREGIEMQQEVKSYIRTLLTRSPEKKELDDEAVFKEIRKHCSGLVREFLSHKWESQFVPDPVIRSISKSICQKFHPVRTLSVEEIEAIIIPWLEKNNKEFSKVVNNKEEGVFTYDVKSLSTAIVDAMKRRNK